MSKSKPWGYVTSTGNAVSANVLDEYAIKSSNEQSNVILDDSFQGKYGAYNLIEPRYNPSRLAQLLELNTYHESAVYRKAHDIAGSGISIKGVGDNPSKQNEEILNKFFKSHLFNIKKVFEAAEIDYQSMGYATIELVKENKLYTGLPFRFKHIPSHTMRLHNSRQMFMQQVGLKKVYYKAVAAGNDVIDDSLIESDLHKDNGTFFKAGSLPVNNRATEVLFFNRYSPRDWFYGIPSITPAIPAIKGDGSRASYNLSFFKNFGIPAYAVFITGNFKDEDEIGSDGNPTGKTVLQAAIETHFRKLARDPHSVLILTLPVEDSFDGGEVKVEFKPLAVDVKEASFRLYRKDNRDEIIAKHQIPPYLIGVYETGQLAGNLGEAAIEIYAESQVQPGQEKYNNAINDYIIKVCFGIEDHTFSFNPFRIDKLVQELDVALKLTDNAAMTPNELRAYFGKKFGLEQVEGNTLLDAFYMKGQPVDPGNLAAPGEVVGVGKMADILDDMANKLDTEKKGLGNKIRGLINGN